MMSNLYVFVYTSWRSSEPVVLDDLCDGLTPFSPLGEFAHVLMIDGGKLCGLGGCGPASDGRRLCRAAHHLKVIP